MTLISILIAVLLSCSFPVAKLVSASITNIGDKVSYWLNAGTYFSGFTAYFLVLILPLLLLVNISITMLELDFLAWVLIRVITDALLLWLFLDFRTIFGKVNKIYSHIRKDDLGPARLELAKVKTHNRLGIAVAEKTKIVELTLEYALIQSYSKIFAPVFWLFVLPNGFGLLIYCLSSLLLEGMDNSNYGGSHFRATTAGVTSVFDSICLRFFSACFILFGNPFPAIKAWYSQTSSSQFETLFIVVSASLKTKVDRFIYGGNRGLDLLRSLFRRLIMVSILWIAIISIFVYYYWMSTTLS